MRVSRHRLLFLTTIVALICVGSAYSLHARSAVSDTSAHSQIRLSSAQRTVYVIPFSHWDTDWHRPFAFYAPLADQNIVEAIRLAQQEQSFRYTLEQVLFVQHFWAHYPAYRAELRALVRGGRFTFAWPGITQPETSLVPAVIQVRNLQLGRRWIATTFGVAAPTAWQSDAFGNSAALPIALSQQRIPYLFIGRWQGHCDPDYSACTPLPAAFYWQSPLDPRQCVLVAYSSYSQAYGILRHVHGLDQQVAALRTLVDHEFARSASSSLFLPFGDDFTSPSRDLLNLVRRWNATNRETKLVFSDPVTAFRALASAPLPHITTDLNPIWQAFYGTRPAAKIAGQESAFLLTAADKLALLTGIEPPAAAWQVASINAHYDNASAVGYDGVWAVSQGPRFAQAVSQAAAAVRQMLGRLARQTQRPLLLFNSAAWARSEVVEVHSVSLPRASLPVATQPLAGGGVAFWASAIPALGYAPPALSQRPGPGAVTVTRQGWIVTLRNDRVSVTVDAGRGGVMTRLAAAGGPNLLRAPGDEVIYQTDNGDVYGAFFGAVRDQESAHSARIDLVERGPLLGRVRLRLVVAGQPMTKTVTLRAGSPLVEVSLSLSVTPQTSVLLRVPTTLQTEKRTDDTGFGAFSHVVDDSPITAGTVTYQREVFYPIETWSDVSSHGAGLSLITHGLQGVGGTRTLNLLLLRAVTDAGSPAREGISDPGVHTFSYAYLPHRGDVQAAQTWRWAVTFNQPLLAAGQSQTGTWVQLPFLDQGIGHVAADVLRGPLWPAKASLLSAEQADVADLYREGRSIVAVVLRPETQSPAYWQSHGGKRPLPATAVSLLPLTPHSLDGVRLPLAR